jgi:poly(3-hydroxyalkanoate) synthetase
MLKLTPMEHDIEPITQCIQHREKGIYLCMTLMMLCIHTNIKLKHHMNMFTNLNISTINFFWDNIQPMTNINVNINNINNYLLQTQQLPFHQLNTNLISCNIPQNCINTTHEDTFLESMKNSLDH